jgi:hypothetical protein
VEQTVTITLSRPSDIALAAERPADRTLFATQAPTRQFLRLPAGGFGNTPACGVICRKDDPVTNSMPLGGIDTGVEITAPLASYALGMIGREKVRLGGDLGTSGQQWSKIDKELPAAPEGHPGAPAALDFSLAAGESRVVRFVLAWHAPTWNAGGYNWAGAPHTFTHMYAKHYASARRAATSGNEARSLV